MRLCELNISRHRLCLFRAIFLTEITTLVLVAEAPSQMAARSLKLVANCLIKLANLTEAKVG